MGLVAFFRAQEPAIPEHRNLHALFDRVIAEFLMQIDFEGTVRQKDDVAGSQLVLHSLGEQIRERIEFERFIDAPARRIASSRVVPRVRFLASLGRDDEISQALSTRAECDFQRRMAADGTQREGATVVAHEQGVMHEARGLTPLFRLPPKARPHPRQRYAAMTIAHLNEADRDEFVSVLGSVFENSPWIASGAWEQRPFDGIDDLYAAMGRVLDSAAEESCVKLIAAHPDLAGRVAREGRLTAASRQEQASAGLDRLTAAETARFDALNGAYRARFGFPFVICARENTKQTILDSLEARRQNDRTTEIRTSIDEIRKIARLRLSELVGAS